MRFIRTISTFLLLLGTLRGQSDANRGQILGTVIDPNHSLLAGVSITARNAATGLRRKATTNTFGQYRILQLDPGEYEITATANGFARHTSTGIVVHVGATVGLNIVLPIRALTNAVDLSASRLNVAFPGSSALVDNRAVGQLPLNGRRFQDFAALTPTVQVEPSRQQLSFSGQRGVNANVMIDGADYNQPFLGGIRGGERSAVNFTIPQNAIQEFQVVTAGYTAEYGRSTGGVLNTITKSGTNGFHGDAFFQLRPPNLGRNNPILNRRPSEKLQQFGTSAGGPLRLDRQFWFVAYEQQLARIPRQVLFPQLSGRAPTPATREALDFFRTLEESFDQTNRNLAVTGRWDYQFTGGHRLTVRYNFQDSVEVNAISSGAALMPNTNLALSNEGTEKDRNHFLTAQYTRLLISGAILDSRLSRSSESRPRLPNSTTPTVVAAPIGNFGTRAILPTVQSDSRWQATQSVSWLRGKHGFKAGYDYNRLHSLQSFGSNQFGLFSTSGTSDPGRILALLSSGSGQNRFDGREVTYSRQIGNLVSDFGLHQIGLFAQDSWRLGTKLTIDYGFRWEAQLNPRPETGNTDLVSRLEGFRFPNGAVLDPKTIRNSVRQFMPRLGFAWTPWTRSPRTVVRGHTGIFYAATPMLLFSAPINNLRIPPGDISITLAPTATQTVYQQLLAVGVDLNASPLSNLPVIPVETVQRAAALASGGAARSPFTGASLALMAPDWQNPRSVQAGFGVESEVFSNFIAGVQLHYLNAVHLHRNRDYNLPPPVVRAGDGRPVYGLRSNSAARPIPALSAVLVRESSARSLYRGATIEAQYRLKRFQFAMYYTWSENFSDDDSERDATATYYDNGLNFGPEYGYSNIDFRHQVTSNFVIQLPFGFDAAGVFRLRSGAPMNARTGADDNEDLLALDRPYSERGVVFQRNSFRNRPVVNDDLRITKSFRITETGKLQFSAEFFNLVDIDNVIYGSTATIYGPGIEANGLPRAIDPRFQRLKLANGAFDPNNQQVGNPLQIQLGLRFLF